MIVMVQPQVFLAWMLCDETHSQVGSAVVVSCLLTVDGRQVEVVGGKRQLVARERVCSFGSACSMVKESGLDLEVGKRQAHHYGVVNMVVVPELLQLSVFGTSRRIKKRLTVSNIQCSRRVPPTMIRWVCHGSCTPLLWVILRRRTQRCVWSLIVERRAQTSR